MVLSTSLLGERPSLAEGSHRVVLLWPTSPDELTTMALTRIKGELQAAGFEVLLEPQADDVPPRTAVETAGIEHKPLAVFAIFGERARIGTTSSAEIWVSERLVDRTSVERMRIGSGGRGATVLAIRAVEILKASLSDFWMAPDRPIPPVKIEFRPPARREAPEPEPSLPARPFNDGYGIQTALGMLASFGEIGPVWAPLLTLSYGTPMGWGARITLGGLGSDAILKASAGTGRVEQQLGFAEAIFMSRWRGPVQLFGAAGIGAYHLYLEGTGSASYRGKNAHAWSALAGAGAGVTVEVHPRIALVVEGRSYWAMPPATIRIDDELVGNHQWPLLLGSAGLGVTF